MTFDRGAWLAVPLSDGTVALIDAADAQIVGRHSWQPNGRLGEYVDPRDAARAYDCAARTHFGAFARPNFGEVST